MDLALNTRQLLGLMSQKESFRSTAVEYHFLSWRELYDKSIITADRHSSGAAHWVIQGGGNLYTVTVVSRPYYKLPQELCLSFSCFARMAEAAASDFSAKEEVLPIEQVAFEFLVLLSVFARESLVLLGPRRIESRPIVDEPHKQFSPTFSKTSNPIAFGINSREFNAVISGLAQAPEVLVQAVLGAAKFYHAGLSLIGFDPSVAYVSFVSAIECLAGHHYKTRQFDFDTIPKFEKVGDILADIGKASPQQQIEVSKLKEELICSEHFLRQKFVLFLEEFVRREFWDVPDELYKSNSAFPAVTQDNFSRCLREIYDARSAYVHGGSPYPEYVDFGFRERTQGGVFCQLMELRDKESFIPPLTWFERLSHTAIVHYIHKFLSPDIAQSEISRAAEKERLLKVITELPSNVQDSLRKLAYWTVRFIGAALINPHAPNSEWADSAATIEILKTTGIIGGEGSGLQGSSWLKDRQVGEIAGEFVFGVQNNPFRSNELLLPKIYEQS